LIFIKNQKKQFNIFNFILTDYDGQTRDAYSVKFW